MTYPAWTCITCGATAPSRSLQHARAVADRHYRSGACTARELGALATAAGAWPW